MLRKNMAVAIVLVAACLLAALTPGLWAQPLQQQQTVTRPGGTEAPYSLTEAQQTGTARRAMLGDKVSPGRRTDAPPTAPAQGGLLWFCNQPGFEAYNEKKGKVKVGTEDYEESKLGPDDLDMFDDPLVSGVPNSPDGWPFPVGMTGLPNLKVQSNVGGGNPSFPDPSGVNGLAAVSGGFPGGVVSDAVVTFSDESLDLIFNVEKNAVGFNTILLQGGGRSVEIRVYTTNNVLLGMITTPADPSGATFTFGTSSTIASLSALTPASAGAVGAQHALPSARPVQATPVARPVTSASVTPSAASSAATASSCSRSWN